MQYFEWIKGVLIPSGKTGRSTVQINHLCSACWDLPPDRGMSVKSVVWKVNSFKRLLNSSLCSFLVEATPALCPAWTPPGARQDKALLHACPQPAVWASEPGGLHRPPRTANNSGPSVPSPRGSPCPVAVLRLIPVKGRKDDESMKWISLPWGKVWIRGIKCSGCLRIYGFIWTVSLPAYTYTLHTQHTYTHKTMCLVFLECVSLVITTSWSSTAGSKINWSIRLSNSFTQTDGWMNDIIEWVPENIL